MSCQEYERYVRGELPELEFQAHAAHCAECAESLQFERKLAAQITDFKKVGPSANLWFKVRARLLREEERRGRRSFGYVLQLIGRTLVRRPAWQLAMAVVVLIVAVIGIVRQQNPPSRLLLTDAAVERVEKKEREYERAIAQLEGMVTPLLADAETDLMLLYRDKLETLDSQIARCKEALELNPYNAHVRRYLLAAYQQKKETLREVAGFATG